MCPFLSVLFYKLLEQNGALSNSVGTAPHDMQVTYSERKHGCIIIKYKFDEKNNIDQLRDKIK